MSDGDAGRAENMEQIVALARGLKGAKGDKGDTGPRLPASERRAVVTLFTLGACLAAVCVLGIAHYARQLHREQQIVAAQQRAIERQGRQIAAQQAAENRIRCTSIAQVTTIPVPHPLAGNPSREWEAAYEHIQRNRGIQLGCRLPEEK